MIKFVITFSVSLIICMGCRDKERAPKPRAYPRVEYPEHTYTGFSDAKCPFTFELPAYAEIKEKDQSCWFDIFLPVFQARIHCSYLQVQDRANFDDLVKDAYVIASKINERANYMEEARIRNENNVNGLMLSWTGPAASPIHFFLTDTTEHFFKAALYFDSRVKPDSLAPIAAFIRADIDHMIATFNWTKN